VTRGERRKGEWDVGPAGARGPALAKDGPGLCITQTAWSR